MHYRCDHHTGKQSPLRRGQHSFWGASLIKRKPGPGSPQLSGNNNTHAPQPSARLPKITNRHDKTPPGGGGTDPPTGQTWDTLSVSCRFDAISTPPRSVSRALHRWVRHGGLSERLNGPRRRAPGSGPPAHTVGGMMMMMMVMMMVAMVVVMLTGRWCAWPGDDCGIDIEGDDNA
jgi:hypothetical protein